MEDDGRWRDLKKRRVETSARKLRGYRAQTGSMVFQLGLDRRDCEDQEERKRTREKERGGEEEFELTRVSPFVARLAPRLISNLRP